VMADTGIKATAATTNLFYHKVFKDGGVHEPRSEDPGLCGPEGDREHRRGRPSSGRKSISSGVAARGARSTVAKDPIESAKRFREALDFLCDYVIDNSYKMVFLPGAEAERAALRHLPAGRPATPLAFINTLDHSRDGRREPRVAHIKMAGLNPLHEFAQALEAKKTRRHPPQRPEAPPLRPGLQLRMGQPEGSRAGREAPLGLRLRRHEVVRQPSVSHRAGTVGPMSNENMKTYKLFEAKVDEINADTRPLPDARRAPGGSTTGASARSSRPTRRRRSASSAATSSTPEKMPRGPLLYEQIDQRLTEILLGA